MSKIYLINTFTKFKNNNKYNLTYTVAHEITTNMLTKSYPGKSTLACDTYYAILSLMLTVISCEHTHIYIQIIWSTKYMLTGCNR